jgi:hypothetical protein
MATQGNPTGRRAHLGSRIHLTGRKPIRRKAAAKINLGKAVRRVALATNEKRRGFSHSHQISPWTGAFSYREPAFDFLTDSKCRRNRPALPDELWIEAGIRRCLGLFQSGRDFLQDLADRHDIEILFTTFVESLKSKRRLFSGRGRLGLRAPCDCTRRLSS